MVIIFAGRPCGRTGETVSYPAPIPRSDRKEGLLHIHLSFVFWKRVPPLSRKPVEDAGLPLSPLVVHQLQRQV